VGDINTPYTYSHLLWQPLLTVLFLLALAVYSWRHRNAPGALPFMVGCLFTNLATFGLLMTYLGVDPDTKIFWFRFMTSWMLPATTSVTCFILEYAWPGRWLTRRNLVVLSIVPLFFGFYFLGGGYTLLGPIDFTVNETVMASQNLYSQLFVAYILIQNVVNLIVFTWLFIRSPQHRWPVVLMAASQIAMRVLTLGGPSFSVQVFSIPLFALPYMAYAVGLFSFHIFDPIPLARQTAIDQLYAGMIVIDPHGRVVSLNPAAERMLGATTRQAKGRLVRAWLPADPPADLTNPGVVDIEFGLGAGAHARCLQLTGSQLKDFRGLSVGYLLMLRDITEQKQANAQIVEQQRALATQSERERMARELHDSLGQVLSYASLQVETTAQLLQEGQGEAAAARLTRLGGVVRDAHTDLRETILNLHSTASMAQPFFAAVKQYLDSFTRACDIQTRLEVAPGMAQRDFSAELKLQLLRVLQEATSNARKHGHARLVRVAFQEESGRLGMTIQDDGCGFAPEEVAQSDGSHYGLLFMRERAAALGGSLQVISAPGSGVKLLFSIPDEEA